MDRFWEDKFEFELHIKKYTLTFEKETFGKTTEEFTWNQSRKHDLIDGRIMAMMMKKFLYSTDTVQNEINLTTFSVRSNYLILSK